MKTAVILRHIHFEDLGTLGPLLIERGYVLQYLVPGIDDLSCVDAAGADLIIVLGGPIGAFDDEKYPFLADELRLIELRLASRRPLLGICLGAQLVARAMGAQVSAMATKEIGFAPLLLTTAGKASVLAPLAGVPVFHWHGDQYQLPVGAAHLAKSERCDQQAFAIGEAVLGFQFHLEIDAGQIERWLIGHACELELARIDPCRLREDALKHGHSLAEAAHLAIGGWLDLQHNQTRLDANSL